MISTVPLTVAPSFGAVMPLHARQRLRPRGGRPAGGRMTESMTWITPFEAMTSVATMLAPLIIGLPSMILKVTGEPCSVLAVRPSLTAAAFTSPDTTW